MKLKHYIIPIYNTKLMLVHITREDLETEENINSTIKLFNDNQIIPNPDEFIKDSYDKNSCGVTYSNKNWCTIVTIFIKLDEDIDNIICHEKRHIEDLISDWYNLNGREALAYLAGYLGKLIYDFNKLDDNIIE